MALSQDQDDEVTKNIMGQMNAPAFAPSSFDVNTMGPNLDSTVKMAGAPASVPPMAPPPMPAPTPAPAPMPTVAPAPPVNDGDDDETRKSNPKVASSHPGFDQDELEKYLLKQKGEIDKYGADNQAASMKNLHDQQNGVVSSIGRRMAGASDSIMQGVARAGNSGNLAAYDARQARNEANNNAQLEQLNAANTAAQKAKMGLDTQSNQNPLGQAAAATMLPILKQLYPGKTDAEYMQMARDPAVAESLLPESVKLKDAQSRLEESRAQREVANEMRRENMDYRKSHDYDTRLEKDTAGFNKDPNVVKAQGTLDKLKTARELLESANPADINNNRVAKNMLQTALTFVATGGQRVNEVEMKAAGGPQIVTNKINMWIQNLDKGALTPLDYRDMKNVIGMYERSAHSNLSDARGRVATQRAQREHISPEQARRELGGEDAAPVAPQPGAASVPTIGDQASYDALPTGAKYLGPDGTPHTKKR